MPSPVGIAERLASFADELRAEPGLRGFEELLPQLDDLCVSYVLRALRQLGWNPEHGQLLSTPALADLLGVASRHRRLLQRLLEGDDLRHRGVAAEDSMHDVRGWDQKLCVPRLLGVCPLQK